VQLAMGVRQGRYEERERRGNKEKEKENGMGVN
jgi:hypothetical protein